MRPDSLVLMDPLCEQPMIENPDLQARMSRTTRAQAFEDWIGRGDWTSLVQVSFEISIRTYRPAKRRQYMSQTTSPAILGRPAITLACFEFQGRPNSATTVVQAAARTV